MSIRKTPTLLVAAADCDMSRVRELLRLGADVNEVNRWGQTALHVAAAARDGKSVRRYIIVDLLIKGGADVNALDRDLHTPLYFAIPMLSQAHK